jgi:hypothetical protein
MGMFAEIVHVDYRFSFVDQGKQTSVFRFYLQQTNRSCRIPLVTFFCKYICINVHIHIDIYNDVSKRNGKRNPRSFFKLQTVDCHLSVCWQRNRRKLSICKWTRRTCPSMKGTHVWGFILLPNCHIKNLPYLLSRFLNSYKKKVDLAEID